MACSSATPPGRPASPAHDFSGEIALYVSKTAWASLRKIFSRVYKSVRWSVFFRPKPTTETTHASPLKIAYVMVAMLILIPLLFTADGRGGGSTTSPAAQKTSIVTPSGTSTLVITPTTTNAAGKPLQVSPIQLTLVVN